MGLTRIDNFLEAEAARLQRRAEGIEQPIPLPWEHLATAVGGGLWPGLYVIVGGTGVGKTQTVLDIIRHAAGQGVPTGYIGLEMTRLDFIARLLGLESDTPWSDHFLGKTNPTELLALVADHAPALAKLPLWLEFSQPNGWPRNRLIDFAKELRGHHPQEFPGEKPILLVLDYVQLVGPSNPREDTRQVVKKTAYIGRALAEEGITTIMVSSTSRDNYSILEGVEHPHDTDPRKLVGTGKESGDIEYACDGLWVMTRQPNDSTMWCASAKFRAGKACWLPFHFDGTRMRSGASADLPRKLRDLAFTRARSRLMPGHKYSRAAFAATTKLQGEALEKLIEALLNDGVLVEEGNSLILKG